MLNGYGFITICDEGKYNNKDIFVHYKSIRVTNSQYIYLIQGEYVDFTLLNVSSDTHEFKASDVSGVKNGPILCESKNIALQVVAKKYQKNTFTEKNEQLNDSSGFIRVESKRNRNKPLNI